MDEPDELFFEHNRLVEVLDRCITSLPLTVHPSHHARLRNISQWFLFSTHHDYVITELTDETPLPLETPIAWSEQSGVFSSITPYGTALIIREQSAKLTYTFGQISERYRAKIRDSSGAELHMPTVERHFASAEVWMRKTLHNLEDERIAEPYIPSIHYTLAICRAVVPLESDDIQRLDYLKDLITEYLA
jgi:hypothetical protein